VDAFASLQRQIALAAIPPAVRETLLMALSTVKNQDTTGLLSLGIVVALWSGSGAVYAMIKAFNRAYDVTDPRSFARRRLIALVLTVALTVVIVAAFVLMIFGDHVGQTLSDRVGLGRAFALAWNYGRWPLTVFLFMIALDVLYWAGPGIAGRFRFISPGAVLATLLWLGASWGFGFYLDVSDPGTAYGTVGTVVVLLLFLYISSIVMLIGAEVNAVLDKHFEPAVVLDKAAHPERQTEDYAEVRQRAIALLARQRRRGVSAGAGAQRGWLFRHQPLAGASLPEPADVDEPTDDGLGRRAVVALALSMATVVVAGLIGLIRRGPQEHA
jgi:membrane protein